jgi:diguanylate cyclase (GGDEF)-like protein
MGEYDEEKTCVTQIVQQPARKEGPAGNDCLVVIYASDPKTLGKRFVLDQSTVRVGRGSDNTIVIDGDSVSRRHCVFEKRGESWWCVDETSTNGTYVNDERVKPGRELKNGDKIKIGPNILKYLSGLDVESQYHEEIYRMTIIDGLTGAHVKRYFLECLEKEMNRARRHRRPLCLVMFDIDHFKKVNDQYGHLAGDHVLKEVARIVSGRVRRDEIFARYGGEEFALILPETPLEGAINLAEMLRSKASEAPYLFADQPISVTISLGIAQLADDRWSTSDFIQVADDKLYQAKRNGRNRVEH